VKKKGWVCVVGTLLLAALPGRSDKVPPDWRYVEVFPSTCAAVGDHPSGSLLVQNPSNAVYVQYDFTNTEVPLGIQLNCKVFAPYQVKGAGANPLLVIYEVESDWTAQKSSPGSGPEKIRKLTEIQMNPLVPIPISFSIDGSPQGWLSNGKVSFLIEMMSEGSKAVELLESPRMALAVANLPDPLIRPVWDGLRIDEESLLPTSYENRPAEAKLLFAPSKIIRVQNYALTRSYEEGPDYVVEGRTLRLTTNSTIPFLNYTDLYPDDPNSTPGVMKTIDGSYLTFSGTSFFNDHQLVVTYEHKAAWDGPVPVFAEPFLPKTFAKLKSGQPLKLAVFGDSISQGANASGMMTRPPFMPRWADLVAGQLRQFFGSEIDCINPSEGGTTSLWGRTRINGMVSCHKPDLVILGFGMNDAGGPESVSAEQFITNLQFMMDSVRTQNPDAEFVLLMSFQPNSRWRNLDLMKDYLKALKAEEGPGVTVVDMWSIHDYLLEHKTYWDMTGNHVNHPNDFLVRVYAEAILSALGVTAP
jgi:hypothetical protein